MWAWQYLDWHSSLFIISHTNKLQFRHFRRLSSCTSVFLGSRHSSIIAVESSPVCQFKSYKLCLEITAIYCEFLFAVHYLLCVSLLRPCQRVKFGLILYFRTFGSEDCRRISYLPCGYYTSIELLSAISQRTTSQTNTTGTCFETCLLLLQ
jgi:hypothetical protein